LSYKLRELTLTSKRTATEFKEKRERARVVQNEPVLDRNGVEITIDCTIEVINGYTKFSKTLPNSRQLRGQLFRGQYIQNYDIGRFGKFTYIQRTGYLGKSVIKVHFVTDSGFETWRIAKNVEV